LEKSCSFDDPRPLMQLTLHSRDHYAHPLSFNVSMNMEVGIKIVRDYLSMLNKE
jgi:hypothetical protein